ncbi:hypothetical protein S40285_10494 [Stachybotrys chlorohalonatus IBT 40285]|uniref:Uncharacterized protein n=1 Tax=Stachybotrys chlorohalonatus (strain IBT 40285) TaxID=1283841 RepID=A0A084Q8E1_STAC4|nr:hypothetical protein S40285_10494 [Stachybotrys chlorohalonata IBT 40285]
MSVAERRLGLTQRGVISYNDVHVPQNTIEETTTERQGIYSDKLDTGTSLSVTATANAVPRDHRKVMLHIDPFYEAVDKCKLNVDTFFDKVKTMQSGSQDLLICVSFATRDYVRTTIAADEEFKQRITFQERFDKNFSEKLQKRMDDIREHIKRYGRHYNRKGTPELYFMERLPESSRNLSWQVHALSWNGKNSVVSVPKEYLDNL